MNDEIASLDDKTAVRVLSTIVRAKFPDTNLPNDDARALSHALCEAAGAPVGSAPPSDGDLARLALQALAQDASLRDNILALAEGPTPQNFTPETAVLVVTAAIFVLQLRFGVKRTAAGKWSVEVGKDAASDDVIKALITAVSGIFRGGNTAGTPALPARSDSPANTAGEE